jgi:lipid-binding SYLF domain-containing protein
MGAVVKSTAAAMVHYRDPRRPDVKQHRLLTAATTVMAVLLAGLVVAAAPALAQNEAGLEASSKAALSTLKATVPLVDTLEKRAYAVLVFPDVTKAGFLIGGEYGKGTLFRAGKVAGYYDTAGVSYGLQAGAQTFGYAMFFMNERAFQALNAADGFQVGAGPSVVVMDEGKAKSVTTATLTSDVYAFVFGQQGLMAGVGLEGTKITKLKR